MKKILISLLLLLIPHSIHAAEAIGSDAFEALFAQGVKVDLREPTLCDGVITTTKGGVITGPNLRIQAQSIKYTRKVVDKVPVFTIEAEDDVMLEFGDYLFVGKRLEYDFQTKTGMVYDGRTGLHPWFFGGERIALCADGSYIIYNGFITTSENYDSEWEINAAEAHVSDDRYVTARNVRFRFFHIPILWIPRFQANLDTFFDSPMRYTFRWGGHQGPRLGLSYEFFSWSRFRARLLLDWRLRRGPGAGIETHYVSEDGQEYCDTINYVANDNSLDTLQENYRYRFEGRYHNSWDDDRTTLDITWDKLSDMDMATDYKDKGLELDEAQRTQLILHRQEEDWVANFVTRVRVNTFQSVKQELPTFEASLRPINIAETGIISESYASTSYLDYKYANVLRNVHDYHSGRHEVAEKLYRPFRWTWLNITPEIGGQTIYYDNSPQDNAKVLAIANASCAANTQFYKVYDSGKHVIRPYTRYDYYTFPTANPNEHYIFDINDGLYRLNQLKFGVCQNFYRKDVEGCVRKSLSADLWAYAFFDTPTIPATVPVVYSNVIWNSHPTLRHTVATAWNLWRNDLYHFNFRSEWTINDDMALAAEYRHRDKYDWRKADKTNFMLDSFRPVHELLRSQLSDRRDTIILHLFCRLNPDWAFEFESRHGWNRRFQPIYNEFEFDILTSLTSAINLRISYQHKENQRGNDRVAFYFSLSQNRPDQATCYDIIPFTDF